MPDKHSHHGHHGGGGGGGGGTNVAAPSDERRRLTFAEGSTEYPTPIQGLGGALTAGAAGGNISTLTPVPKTGFVGRLRHTISGTITVGTLGTAYQVPLHRLIANYTLQNSLAYPYRNLNGDDVWMWSYVNEARGLQDPIYGSQTSLQPIVTSTGAKPFQFSFVDQVAMNDGINFSKFLLSALTNSNDLTLLIGWLPFTSLATLQQNTTVFSAYTASDAVSCVYQTVPDPDHYYWPDTSVVQQVIGDPSFSATAVGVNSINLTPISGPEFMGLGIQVINAGGTPDTLVPNTSGIVQVALLVGGSIPLKTFTLSDLVTNFENTYGRPFNYGYLYIDMMADLSIPNVMSATMRKALSTTKYAQLTVAITTNANFTPGAGSRFTLLKRTRQAYAGNSALM